MVWIEATATYRGVIHASRRDVVALIRDVSTSGPLFPGVDRIEPLDDDRYRWVIKERRTLGISFIGNYIARYTVRNETDVVWETIEGNMKTRGAWKTSGPDGRVRVEVTSTTELDAPVPRLMKKPAELFAIKETRDGLKAQLEGIKAMLESPTRSR